ncbi:hypothetical protein KCP75_15605 [Salmonella enterica subsp. enterica]|nr:hypothetical protein KCP75_15605 [Salmonella enterica subsp. enterica]
MALEGNTLPGWGFQCVGLGLVHVGWRIRWARLQHAARRRECLFCFRVMRFNAGSTNEIS